MVTYSFKINILIITLVVMAISLVPAKSHANPPAAGILPPGIPKDTVIVIKNSKSKEGTFKFNIEKMTKPNKFELIDGFGITTQKPQKPQNADFIGQKKLFLKPGVYLIIEVTQKDWLTSNDHELEQA